MGANVRRQPIMAPKQNMCLTGGMPSFGPAPNPLPLDDCLSKRWHRLDTVTTQSVNVRIAGEARPLPTQTSEQERPV